MKSKTGDVKIDFVTRFLLGVAVFCPLFFFLCCAGLFTAEGGMSNPLDHLMATVAPVGYLAAGFFGFLASLFAVIRSKKRKAKRAVADTSGDAKPAGSSAKSSKSKGAKSGGTKKKGAAYAVGKRIGRTKGMFGAFVDEYKKASK